MADNVIRKACDRCHSQKLSCKRVGDEACERCVRLHAECKSSPSLRYKKQHQHQHPQQHQQQQQQQHQHQAQQKQHTQHHNQHQHQPQQHQQQTQQQHLQSQQHPSTSVVGGQATLVGRRSPKRRRTGSDLDLLQPEGAQIHPPSGDITTSCQSVVGSEAGLELGDFNFNFEQLAFLTPPQTDPLAVLPGPVDAFQNPSPFAEPWEQQLASSADPFQQIAPSAFTPASGAQFHRIVPTFAPRRRPCASEHGTSDRRQRQRPRHRARQIALRHVAHASNQGRETSRTHWMAQLTDINSRLLDLASILPKQQGPLANGRAGDDSSGFPIDEMFKLTRGVADILDRFPATSSGKEHNTLEGADPGSAMFVLSTYVRLLDMYQRVFTMVKNELAQADQGAAFKHWKLPDVTVGSFAVESSPSLQMSLTIQLAEEFLVRLRNATAALDPALRGAEEQLAGGGSGSGGDANSMFSEVVDVSYCAVRAKEEKLGRHLAQLRDEIEAFLDG
ncbi:fungal transcriptional regulatory protein [Purpureocillium lilacinum]|uniref:Fungal transcriptional regulatory protein n=1 Tax=Purpureocillium lilacinum TaxID=33203 RepID=A0A179HNW8_PURLI|nr:fungal transcriptional regulatory protein [Purpureocillium lilacinum]OAQ92125.1 fungal transcriptional regulatory protein [Purpureocillium lilacinum]